LRVSEALDITSFFGTSTILVDNEFVGSIRQFGGGHRVENCRFTSPDSTLDRTLYGGDHGRLTFINNHVFGGIQTNHGREEFIGNTIYGRAIIDYAEVTFSENCIGSLVAFNHCNNLTINENTMIDSTLERVTICFDECERGEISNNAINGNINLTESDNISVFNNSFGGIYVSSIMYPKNWTMV